MALYCILTQVDAMNNKKNESTDIPVDGAGIAAEILRRMPASTRNRLIQEMSARAPEVTNRVEAKLNAPTLPQDIQHKPAPIPQTIERQVAPVSREATPEPVKNVVRDDGMISVEKKQEIDQPVARPLKRKPGRYA